MPAITYDLRGTLEDDVALSGGTKSGAGVSVISVSTLPPTFKILDPRIVATTPGQWMSIRLSASAGGWASVCFRPDAEGQYSFLIRGDGVMRTYNVWLGAVYNIPRSQSDTEKGPSDDPAADAEAAGTLMKASLVIRGSSKLLPWNTRATVDTTSGNKTLTAVTPTAGENILFGNAVKCPGFPVGVTVSSYNATTSTIVLNSSANASANQAGVTATFQYPITIYPSTASGASAVVEFLKLQAQPEGPTVLIVDWCCPARALLRINTTTVWGIRVCNAGGITATGIALTFTNLSAGLTVGAVTNVPDRIPPDEDRTIFFEVTSTVADAFLSMDVTVSCAQGDSVTYEGARGWYYGVKPTGLTANVVPAPGARPTKQPGCPLIGVWLFPPWKQWYVTVGHSFERRPELGYASYNEPEFWKWHIKWLSEHGVDYVLIEWIERLGDEANKTFARECMNEGFLPALETPGFAGKLKFEINYICGGDHVALPRDKLPAGITLHEVSGPPSAGTGAVNDFYYDSATGAKRLYGPKASVENGGWNTTLFVQATPTTTAAQCIYACNFLDMFRKQVRYFTHPDYLYTPAPSPKARYSFFNMCTGFYAQVTSPTGQNAYAKTDDKDTFVETLLARANQLAIAGGVTNGMSWGGGQTAGGKVPVEQAGGSDVNATYWSGIGFDRCNLYNWFGQGSPANVEDAANSHAAAKVAWAENGNITHGIRPQVCINAGFDNHRWKQNKRITEWTVTGWTYEYFRDVHLADAMIFFEDNDIADREVLINSLDEYGEGSYIAPIAQFGYKMLGALLEVFYPAATPPTIVGPADIYATPAAMLAALPQDPIALFRWSSTVTAYPAEDVNTNAKEGIQVPPDAYPAVEGIPCRRVVTWRPA